MAVRVVCVRVGAFQPARIAIVRDAKALWILLTRRKARLGVRVVYPTGEVATSAIMMMDRDEVPGWCLHALVKLIRTVIVVCTRGVSLGHAACRVRVERKTDAIRPGETQLSALGERDVRVE